MSRFPCVLKSWMFLLLIIGLMSVNNSAYAAQGLPFKLPQTFIELKPLALDQQQRRWLEDRGRLRVGISIGDYAPMDIANERNRYQGISADYLSLVRDKLGADVEVLGFSKRDQAVAALLSGKIDILASANGYERGIEGLLFSADYMTDRLVIVGRADCDSDSDWDGKKIGFLDGGVDPHVADAFYPSSEIILTPTLHSALEALDEGDIDALVAHEVIVRAFKTLRPYSGLGILGESALPESGFAFATRRDDPQLQALIDRALSSLDDSMAQVILSRWTTGLGGSIGQQRIKLLPHEQAWIKQNPVVLVGSQQYPPYIFKNGEKRWDGLNAEILLRISRMTGLQFVHQESLTTTQTLEMLKSGKVHMNTTLSKNAERQAFLNFTYSYGGAPWVFVVRSNDFRLGSLDQLSGKVLALPARHSLESMIRRNYPDVILRNVENYTQARDMVKNGDAVATIQNEVQAYLHSARHLKVGRSVDGRWSSDNFSVSNQLPELLDILNKGLEAIPMADMQALRHKWLHEVSRVNLESLQSVTPWLYAGGGGGIGLVLMLLWNRRLVQQIRLRGVAESALKTCLRDEQRYFDALPFPIFMKGLKGQMITCNRAYEDFFSTRRELIHGRSMSETEFLSVEAAEQLQAALVLVLSNRKPSYQKRSEAYLTDRGELNCWLMPFYSGSGHLEGAVGVWFDVSEQKKQG